MSGVVLGLLAETSIHVGVGQVDGAIDLPVAREGGTGYPFAPGSGVKGALRDEARDRGLKALADKWFGTEPKNGANPDGGSAGEVLVGDLRLLLLPVRSLTGSYQWLTCPHLIERFVRDCTRLGLGSSESFNFDVLNSVERGRTPKILRKDTGLIYLEERLFESASLPEKLDELLQSAIPYKASRTRLPNQLGVVSDKDFAWFARHALPVAAHNKLNENTKSSENLWFEETMPPDTVMVLTLVDRRNNGASEEAFDTLFGNDAKPYLRVGGNETTGQGWFQVGTIADASTAKEGPADVQK
jgi:CRISPR-associated protein Cmr4